jgi:hypothetical protein
MRGGGGSARSTRTPWADTRALRHCSGPAKHCPVACSRSARARESLLTPTHNATRYMTHVLAHDVRREGRRRRRTTHRDHLLASGVDKLAPQCGASQCGSVRAGTEGKSGNHLVRQCHHHHHHNGLALKQNETTLQRVPLGGVRTVAHTIALSRVCPRT